MSDVNVFNFCTGHSPTVPPVWNSLLFRVAVLHLVVPFLGAEYLHVGGAEYSGWGSVATMRFNPGCKFVRYLSRVRLIPELHRK